jgi:hypothetical protein
VQAGSRDRRDWWIMVRECTIGETIGMPCMMLTCRGEIIISYFDRLHLEVEKKVLSDSHSPSSLRMEERRGRHVTNHFATHLLSRPEEAARLCYK